MARFARTLSTTFSAGIPLVDALVSAAGASGNYVYRTAVMAIRNEVVAGMQINVAMRTVDLFPDMVIQMVMIGEESGAIDDMLSGRHHLRAGGGRSGRWPHQPAGTSHHGGAGVLVGGMVVAMYLPIFKLGSVIHRSPSIRDSMLLITDVFHSLPWLYFSLVFLFSLVIGSFLNVVIHRLPIMLEREWQAEYLGYFNPEAQPQQEERYNLMVPRSACPHCGHAITAMENIPCSAGSGSRALP